MRANCVGVKLIAGAGWRQDGAHQLPAPSIWLNLLQSETKEKGLLSFNNWHWNVLLD